MVCLQLNQRRGIPSVSEQFYQSTFTEWTTGLQRMGGLIS
jgi:hypothetical protein